jgi:hypothetical protein
MAKFVLQGEKLGLKDDFFVEVWMKGGFVEVECFDTHETERIPRELFHWMVRRHILVDYS